MPGAPAPNGNTFARNRSAPISAPHEPMYRLKIAATKTMSPGRIPIPHMILACALAIASQSPRPIANAVGRPVVPDVPWT